MGLYKRKYNFNELEIGDTIHVLGKLSAIRSSASTWGRRYGIWLKVVPAIQGANVTRVSVPITRKIRVRKTLEDRLDKMEKKIDDALRFIALTSIDIQRRIKERWGEDE